jgi:hypothetical protein
MHRKALPIVSVVLVLQPGMWLVHSHAEISKHDPSGKVRPPHFHLRFLFPLWHTPADDSCSPVSGVSGKRPTSDHDYDAVYLHASVLLGWSNGPQVESFVPPSLSGALATSNLLRLASSAAPSEHVLSPLASSQTCPLYLGSLVLLI